MGVRNTYAPIGLIGGMGPEATADLYVKIIRYFQKEKGSVRDNEFPEIIVHSIPAPESILEGNGGGEVSEVLQRSVKMLEENGCKFIVIACNSIQHLIPDIQRACGIPILSIVDAVSEYCKAQNLSRVGLLSTKITAEKDIYGRALRSIGVEVLYPDTVAQAQCMRVIMNILSGKHDDTDRESLIRIAKSLISRGADAVFLACTELPLILDTKNTDLPLVDCTEIYARRAAQMAVDIASTGGIIPQ